MSAEVRPVHDAAELQSALAVRRAVFVEEQRVPPQIEVDPFDPVSLHAVAVAAQRGAVGTGRLLPDGHIGRLAVLAWARGTGVGTLLLRALMQQAAQAGHREVVLNAQMHAVPFYARHGFSVHGMPFDDAGIVHVTMRAPSGRYPDEPSERR